MTNFDAEAAMLRRLPETGLRFPHSAARRTIRDWCAALPPDRAHEIVEFVWNEFTVSGGRTAIYLFKIMSRVQQDAWRIERAETERKTTSGGGSQYSNAALRDRTGQS